MYTYRIEQAIRAAAVLHRSQLRKGAVPLPYVTHVVATAFTVMDYTDDEDVVVAALLHDTLEDTDYTIDELQEDFGGTVRDIVETLTEPTGSDDAPLSWKEQKRGYVAQLKRGPEGALLVAAADKIHNFRTIVEDYYDDHARFMQDFGKNFRDRHEVYQSIANVINSRLKNPIVSEFNHVFAEYKQFVTDVESTHSHT